jgi:superfamily II DNA or RNA helicase
MFATYTLNDLQKTFPAVFFQRGQTIFNQGLVNKTWLVNDRLYGEVAGTRQRPYQQRIDLTHRNGKLTIDGSCDCPIGRNCKHVVASLLYSLRYPPKTISVTSTQHANSESSSKFAGATPTTGMAASLWLQQINTAAAKLHPVQEPDNTSSRLLYVLTPNPQHKGLHVHLMRARPKKDGALGKAVEYPHIDDIAMGRGSVMANEADQKLCTRIFQNNATPMDHPLFGGPGSGALMSSLVESGRAYWQHTEHPPLMQVPPLECQLQWLSDDNDHQRLGVELPEHNIIVPIDPPWRLNTHTQECGELITGLPEAIASVLLRSPPIPRDQIPEVLHALQKQMPEIQWPAPQELQVTTLANISPTPCLVLLQIPFEQDPYWRRRESVITNLPVAQVVFDYHGMKVSFETPGDTLSQRQDQIRLITHRDTGEEARLLEQIYSETELLPVERLFPSSSFSPNLPRSLGMEGGQGWMHFIVHDLPKLQSQGWEIEIRPEFPYQLAESEGDVSIEIEESNGNEWFNLDLGIDVDGQRISLLPILLETFRQFSPEQLRALTHPDADATGKVICSLPDKRLLAIPLARLQGILSILIELFDTDRPLNSEGKLEFDITQAARLAELEAFAQTRWLGGERLLELGRKLRTFHGITPIPVPEGLTTTLRPYQQEGLNWLQFLREYGLAGILADDMGLGKTLQALTHILVEKQSGRANLPSLVIAPTSLMFNWHAEATRFTPALRVLTLHGNERHQHFDQLDQYDLILTTYPLLPRDKAHLLAQQFHLLILDEAHAIKNPKALATQIVHQIPARHRLALTGTPMENHLGELWSQFHFLIPGLLGSAEKFKRQFRNPIEKLGDMQRRSTLTQRIKPFMLRRTKVQVATELPPKTDILRSCELTGNQRDLYESVRNLMQDRIRREIDAKGFKKSQIIILDALLKLRQICCDPRLLKLATAHKVQQSAKLDMLTDLLPEMIEEGRRVLLFSQFTSMLDLIEPELQALKIPFVRLTGDTKNRALPVQRFQEGEVPLFLISLKAGGVGLNLTAADTVIHYDPWWNPAVEDQATGRAHRMGQTNPVFSYKLTTIGTVEEKILHMQERKRELTRAIVDEPSTGVGSFTADELMGLFD